jgi:Protein of unknown function (DUF2992)
MKLTILFNGQFWEGIVELYDGDRLKAGRYIFGKEPQDAEVLELILSNRAFRLLEKSNFYDRGESSKTKTINPKRLARKIAKETATISISTMAQEAMRLDLEQRKKEGKKRSKLNKEAEKEQKRLLARQKAKLKHRGKA